MLINASIGMSEEKGQGARVGRNLKACLEKIMRTIQLKEASYPGYFLSLPNDKIRFFDYIVYIFIQDKVEYF